MRLDKFLKDSRLIKRRTIAKQMCDAGKVSLNGKRAKAGIDVVIGDEITIEYAKLLLTVVVRSLHVNTNKDLAQEAYEEIKRESKV